MAQNNQYFKTFKEGLSRVYTVSQLKSLGAQISTRLPTRKAELVGHINNKLVFTNLKEIVGLGFIFAHH